MTIELPERHPSPPLHPCTEPNSETFEKLRRTRLLLMNLVREGVLHRSEYARLMRRTLIDHFVVDGARHGSQFASARDVMIQLLDLVDRGAFVKGVDLVDWTRGAGHPRRPVAPAGHPLEIHGISRKGELWRKAARRG